MKLAIHWDGEDSNPSHVCAGVGVGGEVKLAADVYQYLILPIILSRKAYFPPV